MADKTDEPKLMDAPNQQVVRPDGSGPGGKPGKGGSTREKPKGKGKGKADNDDA